MKYYVFLAYNRFDISDKRTLLSPFIRTALYFHNRGLNGGSVKWHHCGIIVKDDKDNIIAVYEALAEGIVKGDEKNLWQYEFIKQIPVEVKKKRFQLYLDSQVGVKYAYCLVMIVKLIYQTVGVWILPKNYKLKKHDCSTFVMKGLFLHLKSGNEKFKGWIKGDPQDLVRIFK